jgi:RimJ/RimL family protein N-acetyltransferase
MSPDNPHDHRVDAFGRPIGPPLEDWTQPPRPPRSAMVGRFVELVPTDIEAQSAALFEAFTEPADFTYLFDGPFDDAESFTAWMHARCSGDDPLFHTILVDGAPLGLASYLRIDERVGSIEVGSLHFSPALQRTPASTEAMFLMMQRAFDLGYRRYEWKCDALNAPSRAAATRLGFTFEGIFRQATIYKQRSRDTAWFSIIDTEWPSLRTEFTRWLDAANFGADGTQRSPLDTAHPARHS